MAVNIKHLPRLSLKNFPVGRYRAIEKAEVRLRRRLANEQYSEKEFDLRERKLYIAGQSSLRGKKVLIVSWNAPESETGMLKRVFILQEREIYSYSARTEFCY